MRILAALLFVSAVCFGQATEAKNCSVDGSVVNSVTGAPIPRARVSVFGADDTWFAESDATGKWRIEHSQCGPVLIGAERVGFLEERSLPERESLAADTPLHEVKLKLTPQAVLFGRVLDNEGDPILGAQVSLMTSHVVDGLRAIQASDSTETNDLGEYRFAGLSAGKFIVCADNVSRLYGQKCDPGPADIEPPSTVDVAAGHEGRIDFALVPMATVRVSGEISGVSMADHGLVFLTPRKPASPGLRALVREDGTFVFGNVPAGSYVLSAARNGVKIIARVPLEVGSSNVEGLHLHPEPGFEVTGTVRIVSAAARKVDGLQFILKSPTGDYGPDPMRWDDGRAAFTITGMFADNFRLEVSSPAPFYVKSATLGGRDMIGGDIPIGPGAGNIEIVISDDGGVVEGDVSPDGAGAPAWVLLESNGKAWKNAQTDDKGHFKFDTVPPGEYKIYAWDDNTNVEYANPDWMKRNGKGVAVTVAPGQTAQVKIARQIAPPE